MAGPKTPRVQADRMRDHRAQRRAHDGFVRETFTQPRDDARQTVRESSIATRGVVDLTDIVGTLRSPFLRLVTLFIQLPFAVRADSKCLSSEGSRFDFGFTMGRGR
jgi:hypothetical protein